MCASWRKHLVQLGHVMPLDELADFTTKGTKPVVCQRCHASFESGTQLFFMHNRKGDGPGKHICAGCRQYYVRKTETIKQHTLGQWSYISAFTTEYICVRLQETGPTISRLLRNIRWPVWMSVPKRQLRRLRDRVWVQVASYNFCEASTRAENWYVWQVKTIHYKLACMSTLLPQQYRNQHIRVFPGQSIQVVCNLRTMWIWIYFEEEFSQ